MIALASSTGPRRACVALAGLLACLVAACSESKQPTGPGSMTEGERAALEDAAEMLETRPPAPASTADEVAPSPPDGNE